MYITNDNCKKCNRPYSATIFGNKVCIMCMYNELNSVRQDYEMLVKRNNYTNVLMDTNLGLIKHLRDEMTAACQRADNAEYALEDLRKEWVKFKEGSNNDTAIYCDVFNIGTKKLYLTFSKYFDKGDVRGAQVKVRFNEHEVEGSVTQFANEDKPNYDDNLHYFITLESPTEMLYISNHINRMFKELFCKKDSSK